MNKEELLELHNIANLTPNKVKADKPAIFRKLTDRASERLRSQVDKKLKTAPKHVRDKAAKLSFKLEDLGNNDVKTVLSRDLLKGRLSAEKKKELTKTARNLPRLGKLNDFLIPDLPISINPNFQPDLTRAKTYRLSDIAGISSAKMDRAIGKDLTLNTISTEKLEALVKDKTLTKSDAEALGLQAALHDFMDSSFELVEYVNKTKPVKSFEEVVKFDRTDWENLIAASKVDLPKGMTSDEYANILFKKAENIFPELALKEHTEIIKRRDVAKSVRGLKPLFDRNKNAFGPAGFEALKLDGIPANRVKKLKKQYTDIDLLTKRYHGLGLETILNNNRYDSDTKAKRVSERVNALNTFMSNNKNINYLTLDYRHDSKDLDKLDFNGIKPPHKDPVLGYAKSFQRVYSFTQDVEDAEMIMSAGYSSSFHVVSTTLPEFIKDTKLDVDTATKYFENAHLSIINTTGVMGSILDILSGSFDWLNVGNLGPDIKDYLRKIPGYQDLFGQMAFCDCEHCQSIYSPAAYFVDLMQFVERYVLDKHFTGSKANHVLNLKVRRPDLWTLPLTCENTTTLVPYLDIINEILESYIAKKKGYTGDLNDRALVEDFVYRREIALEKPGVWKNNVRAFDQPYHHPLEATATYLKHFDTTRADVARLLGASEVDVAKARLHLNEKEFQLITVPDASPTFIKNVYGITFTISAGKIKPFDAQLLLKALGLNRDELGWLVRTQFITNKGVDNILIKGEKISSASVQNDIERIRNLTYDALDRMHRFVRLWRKTPWSIQELDLLLAHIDAAGIVSGIDALTLETVGKLLRIHDLLELSAEDLAVMLHGIPTLSIEDETPSLLDRLFNHEDVVSTEGSYPKDTVKFIHPALIVDESTPSAEFSSSRLMMALNRSDDEILELIKNLAQPLGIVGIDSATEADRGFFLTLTNLSLLYRHSRLAHVLEVTIGELFRLMSLVPDIPNDHVEEMGHIFHLQVFYTWWKASGYSIDELNYIIESGNVLVPDDFGSKDDIAAAILDQVKVNRALLFADTVFTTIETVTEQQSRDIINANIANIDEANEDGFFWLNKDYDSNTALTVPAGITVPEPDLRAVLNQYHPTYLIPNYLSGHLSFQEGSIGKLLTHLGVDLNDGALVLELQEATTPMVEIPALVEKLLPLNSLFKGTIFNESVMGFILDNLAVIGIADLDQIKLDDIKRIKSLQDYMVINDDETDNLIPLANVLASYTNAAQYEGSDPGELALILDTKSEVVSGIHAVVVSATNAVDALDRHRELVVLTSLIGISASMLPKIISTTYTDLDEATQAILAAFRSKYRNENERKEKLEPYQDSLRSSKRASLTTYLIHSGFPQFEDENDLFHYFLIDTELEGCARTSRLVAATMSLQLYIHRILLNLEQDGQDPGTAGRVHVKADDIPGDEWSWRKNYRVWEANRKVFLYPENYVEPELRDNKTPLFEDLETELLQREINADNVLEAYSTYMRGFDEVAHLKIAGSYHEKDEDTETDVLHLFGVTANDPPIYYYRSVENIHYSEKRDDRGVVWGPWRKINVQIPVKKVAPITYNGRLHVFWVRITSLANTVFDENRSIFTGYSHKFAIEFTTLKLDGTWTTPQKLNLNDCYPFVGNGVVPDPLVEEEERADFIDELKDILRSFPFFNFDDLDDEILRMKTPRYDLVPHYEPIDEYTLNGFMWNRVFPHLSSSGRLYLTGVGYQMRAAIDFYNLSVSDSAARIRNVTGFVDPVMEALTIAKNKPGKIISKSGNSIYRTSSPSVQWFDNFAYGSLIVNTSSSNDLLERHWNDFTIDDSFDDAYTQKIASIPSGSELQVINGAFGDLIVDSQGDLILIQGTPVSGNGFVMRRMGTTLSETLTRTLFTSGVDTTLDIATQKALKEEGTPINVTADRIQNGIVSGKMDFTGAYGTYFREIFFHIPFLIANHLNSQGKYADAQKWYHYIFNPTATEVIEFPPGLTTEQKKKMELDRNWQYLEFREVDIQKLRDQLTDKKAIEVYKKDPFNPHAIARLRLSAYQKSIVMKYIDNLLDWGDQLFTQDTMESVNEATMLYIIAREILGDRPAQIGNCGEGKVKPKTYEKISPLLDTSSEFLAELETYTIVKKLSRPLTWKSDYIIADKHNIKMAGAKAVGRSNASWDYQYKTKGLAVSEFDNLVAAERKYMPKVDIKPVDDAVTGEFAIGTNRAVNWLKDSIYVKDTFRIPSFGWSIMRQVSPVFCVPGNKDLLSYYDRVDDRLFKIRNCMNIAGQVRQLALFAPEIDPRLLVRARAAGLSLEDILNATSGNLPPYRFSYILERAKSFTAVVQSFGNSLLSAIERKSGEDLALLRMTQQQNILEISTKSRQLEIDAANEGIMGMLDRIESLNYQIGYYDTLVSERTSGWEIAQQTGVHGASIIRGTEAVVAFSAGILSLIPQVGSPFAMKYGGVELGGSMGKIAFAMNSLADLGDNIAKSAGLEGGFDRRSQGWKHQKKLLELELEQTQKNLTAAELRRDILVEAKEIHNKNIEHNQDMLDFYGEKFSNLGLYTFLSTTMQRLYKEAFNNAMAIARLAEQAYRYERDDNSIFIDGSYFNASRGGLLAGESLLMALQTMERRYLETNYRKKEIDQAFSLTQISPDALLMLKQTGECTFSIPEVYFDLFYPGQYRRKIQSVRLTIPSVTGPYTNVSATLSLESSHVRMEAKTGIAELKEVPKSRTTSIATSSAQSDAGVFSINFRDDRYMPFEGAGAVSDWKLSLPKNFRQFDYNTINDVVVHISYTAEYDELFRDTVEQANGEIETLLKSNNAPLRRMISFRQEFSTDFQRLIHQPANTAVTMAIQNKHFPLFMNGKNVKITRAELILVTPVGETVNNSFDISINTVSQSGFTKNPVFGELYTKNLGSLFNTGILGDHTVTISDAANLAPTAPAPGDTAAVDLEKLEDIVLYLEYKIG